MTDSTDQFRAPDDPRETPDTVVDKSEVVETPEVAEPPKPPPPEPVPVSAPAPRRPDRLYRVAAWVGIAAGTLVILVVVFGSGFFLGRQFGPMPHHGQFQFDGQSQFERGPQRGVDGSQMKPQGPFGQFDRPNMDEFPQLPGFPAIPQSPRSPQSPDEDASTGPTPTPTR